MKPIPSNAGILSCRHGKTWPPASAYMGLSPTEVRAERGDEAMARYLIWQRDCGLLAMNPDKCRACPHVLVAGVPAVPAGSGGVHPPFMRRTRRKRS